MERQRCERATNLRFQGSGFVADYLRGLTDQWLLVAPKANPAMLEMFRDRDSTPLRDLVPWAGEFGGKYLTSAVEILRLTGDERLRRWLQEYVAYLLRLQAEDGYLGPWPQAWRLTNRNSADGLTWDTWGHYHMMLGLMLWHEETGEEEALLAARRIADLLCAKYLGGGEPRLVQTGNSDKNLAPVHALAMLHRKTDELRYLDMALQIVDEFSATEHGEPLAGDYLRLALEGREFHQLPMPRWESLHAVMGLAELYWITGERSYRRAFEHLWWSIAKLDRHNNGGFSSGEQATGNPYDLAPIETCCTVAWMAMSVEMLKLTGDSRVADELELSTLNSVVGMHSHTGRWATYNTPMNGVRRASAHSIVFQAREGSPELNCCSVNSPRGFGLLSEWALMQDEEGLILNWYGPCTLTATRDSTSFSLVQTTEYPLTGRVTLQVEPSEPAPLTLKLRIPRWSRATVVQINGEAPIEAAAGAYLALRRRWRQGDRVEINLDLSLHFWPGSRDCEGLAALYRGPLLLAYDHRYNLERARPETQIRKSHEGYRSLAGYDYLLNLPTLDARRLAMRPAAWADWMPPLLLMETTDVTGRPVRLCDYGSAGEAGTPYASWLPVINLRASKSCWQVVPAERTAGQAQEQTASG